MYIVVKQRKVHQVCLRYEKLRITKTDIYWEKGKTDMLCSLPDYTELKQGTPATTSSRVHGTSSAQPFIVQCKLYTVGLRSNTIIV